LARQSGEMAEKDQEQMLLKITAKNDPLAVQIEQRQFIESNFFHLTTKLSQPDRLPPAEFIISRPKMELSPTDKRGKRWK